MNFITKILLAFIYGSIFSLHVCSQNAELAPPKFTPPQLLEDFQVARQALEEGHSGIYRYSDKSVLDKMFKQTADSLNVPMDAFEFYRKLAPLIAAVKCGHTGIGLPGEIRNELLTRTPLLPFQVKIINGKAFVFRDLSSRKGTAAGKELVKINGVSVSDILKTMFDATSSDVGVQSGKEWRLSRWGFNTGLISLIGLKSPYDLELGNSTGGKIEKLQINGVEMPRLQEKWLADYPQDQEQVQEKEPTANLKFLQNDQIAILKIRSFTTIVDSRQQIRLEDFIRGSFSTIKARKSQVLILDLQDNGGGDDDLGKLLLSYLLEKPFRYYDDLIINNLTFSFLKYANRPDPISASFVEKGQDGRYHAVKHPNWGIHQPQADRFAGPVYTLINGGSFSTTSEFLSQLHFHKRAVFIGEESGGGYYGNSSGFMPTLTLPNTKLTLRVPLMTYYMAVKSSYRADHGVIPDHPIKRSINDYLQEKNVSLTLAIELANKSLRKN